MDVTATTNTQPAPSVEQWRQRGEMIMLNGHQVFVVDEGRRDLPVLLLIHGFPTASWDWALIWPTLSQYFRLITLDMLGFGFSDKPDNRQYSIHGQADLVEALVGEKQLNSFHLLAHDYGDTVAQELLARQNDDVGAGQWLSCCFLNGGLFPETHRALLMQKLLLSPLGPWIGKWVGFSQFNKNFSAIFGPQTKPTQVELLAYWQLININHGKHVFYNLISYMRDRKQHRQRWVEGLQQAKMPLALINGSVDPISGAHMVARYQELNCRLDYLAELETIGHYPQVEAPDDVASHYLAFYKSIDSEQS
jgi:pimeloyl-ACP methyl ester carboxylesterase